MYVNLSLQDVGMHLQGGPAKVKPHLFLE